jgi:hypothetical protein
LRAIWVGKMKKKIPVGATIAHAYRFVFGNALEVFKAIWLPLVAQMAVAFLLLKRIALFMGAIQAHDPAAIGLFGPLLLLIPLALLFFVAQYTAVTELALGRPSSSWVAFHFNRPMWRLLGGLLATIGTIAALAITLLLALLALSFCLDLLMKALPGSRPVVAVLVGLMVAAYGLSFFFFGVRFLFLLAPVNVEEQRLGVRRSWQLSHRNFWRISLITLAIAIPIGLVNQAFGFWLGGFPPSPPSGASKEVRDALQTTWQIAQLNRMVEHWYLTLPLTALTLWFQLGAGAAAQVFAWRKLTEDDGLAPIAGD